jgi:predicted Zn-dependent peptidase
VTTVSVWILVGARDEALPGAAHLLEHVAMQAVPAGRRLRVIDEIESTGGDANAMTSRDSVVLHARVPTPDAPAALALLAEAATAPVFDDELVDAERRVVIEELRLAAADPTDVVHDGFFATAFGAHPIGRPVGGTPAGIVELGVAELTRWVDQSVRAGLTGVVVSGGLPADEVAGVVAESGLGTLPATGTVPAGTAPVFHPGRHDLRLAGDTAAVVLGGRAYPLTDPRLSAAEVVMELLAGGNASVLTEEIRSRRGLSYDVSADATGYRDCGVWRVSISTAPEHCEEVVELATGLVRDAVARGWTATEVSVARRRVAGLLRLDTESSLDDAFLLGQYALVGGWGGWSLAEQLERLAAVDADQVNECARFMAEQIVVATAGGDGG